MNARGFIKARSCDLFTVGPYEMMEMDERLLKEHIPL